MQCPICGKQTQGERVFCSDACQWADLHRWFSGVYRVPTDEQPAETPPSDVSPDESE
ncbi:MAG: DNA gyrase inhibitor YacG [Holosporales bacterium]|nr:DNA gyrase inhibitor YacG [Holosporales bacterium]